MSKFEEFKKVFEDQFDDIYLFLNEDEWSYEDITECNFKYKLQDNLDVVNHDSYGNEDSTLKRVFYIEDFDIYVEFSGTRQSYSGEEWYSYKEVSKTTKTVSVWT